MNAARPASADFPASVPTSAPDLVFSNASIVLADEVVRGSVLVRDGLIADIASGPSRTGIDFEGDHLVPGLVELHTDHIEGHYLPRPKVRWNMMAALQAHDAQIAASGITTVFDALRVGMDDERPISTSDMTAMAGTISRATREDRLRAEHFIHLRCEVSVPDVLEGFDAIAGNDRVRLASLMDHAPGQRQFASLEAHRVYYQGKTGMSDADYEIMCARVVQLSEEFAGPNRGAIAARCRALGIAVASHDDATAEHVAEGIELGVSLAEFPTTIEAARLSHEAGLAVLMGAPNVVRGGSHSGNVSALDLLDRGTLDILSSDYVPFSLVQATFSLGERIGLPAALRLVSLNPARAARLDDRGSIAQGLRADLVRVRTDGERDLPPVVRGVWRAGARVA